MNHKIFQFIDIRSCLASISRLAFIATLATGVLFAFQNRAEALCIKTKKANLRKGPGVKHEKLWEVLKYMPFQKVAQKGAWYQVKDLDGDVYWAHKKLFTKKYQCAVIKQDKTNLRSGPGTKHKKVEWSPVSKYFSLKVLRKKDDWVEVMDAAGDRAWVHRPLIWIR